MGAPGLFGRACRRARMFRHPFRRQRHKIDKPHECSLTSSAGVDFRGRFHRASAIRVGAMVRRPRQTIAGGGRDSRCNDLGRRRARIAARRARG